MSIRYGGGVVNSPTNKDGSTNSKTSDSGHGAPAGSWLIVITASDNLGSIDGNTNEVVSVTDTDGHIFAKAVEFSNTRGSVGNGATVSIWIGHAPGGVPFNQANYFTVVWASNVACKLFSVNYIMADLNLAVMGTVQAADVNSDISALGFITSGEQFLRVRAIASESSADLYLNYFATAGWQQFAGGVTNGQGSNQNMACNGELKISVNTEEISNPNYVRADHASAYAVFNEVA